jgi:hypothetical protein
MYAPAAHLRACVASLQIRDEERHQFAEVHVHMRELARLKHHVIAEIKKPVRVSIISSREHDELCKMEAHSIWQARIKASVCVHASRVWGVGVRALGPDAPCAYGCMWCAGWAT